MRETRLLLKQRILLQRGVLKFGIMLFLVTLLSLPHLASAQNIGKLDIEKYVRDNIGVGLNRLSKARLKEECLKLGFEIIDDEVDEDTGMLIVSTHSDYVQAAKQCVAMHLISQKNAAANQQSKPAESNKPVESKAVETQDDPDILKIVVHLFYGQSKFARDVFERVLIQPIKKIVRRLRRLIQSLAGQQVIDAHYNKELESIAEQRKALSSGEL